MSGKGRVYPPLAIRLAALTNKSPGLGPNGDCWEFTGAKSCGYGLISRSKVDGGEGLGAHRAAYEVAHNIQLPPARSTGIMVLHRCDNRACVNPEHLFLGDAKTNFADMVAKNRRVCGDQKGEKNPGRKLTDDQVREIRISAGTVTEIARRFGISVGWCSTIRSNGAWTHLKGE